ncbi:hypothetical protein [Paenibacillus xerothermodurans]|uniref:Uncharacterized protein n=1 Tax=Paenibacillus xerothermodurans TaxID=1977292 RepID=A0A2W1NKM8_PAEXE|nr:hypothetical protein [Paenibacillus xerothermodurans]PZE19603.1 hypothetical protein CBW46_017975 [Paenibacillus xerothermodurans]
MVKYLIMAVILFASFIPTAGAMASPLAPGTIKTTWLWNTSLVNSPESRNEILEFAAEQHVSRIYLQVDPDVAVDAYRAFIKQATSLGVQIHALDGAPDWIYLDTRHRMTETINWVKAYNREVTEEERFTGIQMDIEPYILPE